MKTKTGDDGGRTERNGKNALEWTVFGVSCLLVAGALGFLLFNAAGLKDESAILRAVPGKVTQRDGIHIVPIHLVNTGSRTASEVNIDVEAVFPSGVRHAGLTIDFIPAGGRREGFVAFTEASAPSSLTPRVTGFIEP